MVGLAEELVEELEEGFLRNFICVAPITSCG